MSTLECIGKDKVINHDQEGALSGFGTSVQL